MYCFPSYIGQGPLNYRVPPRAGLGSRGRDQSSVTSRGALLGAELPVTSQSFGSAHGYPVLRVEGPYNSMGPDIGKGPITSTATRSHG
ncbi:hypothetical protein E2C01_045858 [Portunus trituberculatus]|uniref:Uncharacterized protein n=1 Tax=Portunus trituberculatus TaxID=210409 RepID=A0A5B7G346_PORTR|nr:hypothetical protein [Portunus trituberculatus]